MKSMFESVSRPFSEISEDEQNAKSELSEENFLDYDRDENEMKSMFESVSRPFFEINESERSEARI